MIGSLPSKSLQSSLRIECILNFNYKTVYQVCLILTDENRNVEEKQMQNTKEAKKVGMGSLKADKFN